MEGLSILGMSAIEVLVKDLEIGSTGPKITNDKKNITRDDISAVDKENIRKTIRSRGTISIKRENCLFNRQE